MIKINEYLNQFWGTEIKVLNLNMTQHTIEFQIKSVEDGVETLHEVILKDVVAFCWINGSLEQSGDHQTVEEWDYLALESMEGVTDLQLGLQGASWTKEYSAAPNIVCEIWNSILLVEAKTIVINEQEIHLN